VLLKIKRGETKMSFHFAYIDPGAGSLFFQALLGSLLAGSLIFRRMLSKMGMNLRKAYSRVESVILPQAADK
jgi:hypothetical protein